MRWTWSSLDALSARELHAALALRQRVFVVEQDCVYPDADALDLTSHHLLGTRDDALVAYLRATPRGEGPDAVALSRIVVAPEARGDGLGRALVAEGLDRARATWGALPVTLEAQSHLAAFYGSLGFAVSGEPYVETGIPHVPMRRPS